MHARRKGILCNILSLLPKSTSKTVKIKLLFLIKHKFNPEKFYSFFPYKYGPYSYELERDLKEIDGTDFERVKLPYEDFIIDTVKEYPTAGRMVQYVYRNYPEYVPREIPAGRGIATIGYEGESIDSFLDKLVQNNVNVVVDVRANPFSMKFDFIGSRLKGYLERSGVGYLGMAGLGIRGGKRKDIDRRGVRERLLREYYDSLEKQESSLGELIKLSEGHKIALMCFERDPGECHRGEISRYISENFNLEVDNL